MIKLALTEKKNNPQSPIVVHCSAGVGRTGVFIALTNLLIEIMGEIKKKSFYLNIFNLVRKMKEMRGYLVENINQYQFIYLFVYEYIKEIYNVEGKDL